MNETSFKTATTLYILSPRLEVCSIILQLGLQLGVKIENKNGEYLIDFEHK